MKAWAKQVQIICSQPRRRNNLQAEQHNRNKVFKARFLKLCFPKVSNKPTTIIEMMMFMLVSAVAVAIRPCSGNSVCHDNLKHIFEQYNETLTKVRAHLMSTNVFSTVNY